jgi:acetaldehyde dehydrogenase/alcohol dehydrogenase
VCFALKYRRIKKKGVFVESKKKEFELLVERVARAQEEFSHFTQEQVDAIFAKAAFAAASARIELAKMAVEETGMGIIEDKVIKNHFASEYIYNQYREVKTCGLIEEDLTWGICKYAEPIGIIAGIIPTTNPTSTAIFKALIALKTRNGIIFSPHPRAKKCTVATAKIILDAAVSMGAPKDIIAWIDEPSVELSKQLMQHPKVNLILATGGPYMVKEAYSSGKPAIGVGAGNTPAIIDETCHLKMAVNSILLSKTFDNGVICASEQSVVVVAARYEEVKKEFQYRGAYFLTEDERQKVGALIIQNGKLNAEVVGQPAEKIARLAGVMVPESTKVLIAEVEKIGVEESFSYEKLSPVLGMYKAFDFQEAVDKAAALVEFGGIGHTGTLYTDPRRKERVELFSERMKAGRILVNMPASQGAIGDIYNFRLQPSLTLGCGSWGGNSVSENVGVKHLLNIKTNAERRENMLWFKVPPKIYFKYGCLPLALGDLKGKSRAFLVTDKPLFDMGYAERVVKPLRQLGIDCRVFSDVEPDPTLATVKKGLDVLRTYQPDVIIALGGGSPMDAAKIMWLMYENPDTEFESLALRFMDIRKRIYHFPMLGKKAMMVAIPTTSGTGSEVTPFAVVTDDQTGRKYPIADYELTPNIAIVDPELVMKMPKKLTAYGGFDALVHAIESFVSVFATEFTNPYSLEAIRLLFKYLPSAYREGEANQKAREKVHYAATLAGMGFANGFLGICHSLAHTLGAEFHIAHGLANALMLSEVIRFNATDAPRKQATFPQYKYPLAIERYVRIADHLGLGAGKEPREKVEILIMALEDLKKQIDIPDCIKTAGVLESQFLERVELMAEKAFDDQCTGANPRYPSMKELKEIYLRAYCGNS